MRTFSYSTGCLFRVGWTALLILAGVFLIKYFIFDIMPITGPSMAPTFVSRDVIVLNKLGYLTSRPKRGDNVVLRFPGDPNHARYIKRIIALPGERVTVRNGRVFINQAELFEPYLGVNADTDPDIDVILPADEYYLLGDNRLASNDSRVWGSAPKEDFIGKAFAIIWPIGRAKPITNPVY